jgi:hypothetical protein
VGGICPGSKGTELLPTQVNYCVTRVRNINIGIFAAQIKSLGFFSAVLLNRLSYTGEERKKCKLEHAHRNVLGKEVKRFVLGLK